MRTVRDASGRRYVVEKRSAESSRVRDPETGERRHLPTDELEPVDEDPLSVAASAVPESLRRLVAATRDERTLGLLFELDARGPLAVRDLLAETTLCESDLHGAVTELRVVGIVAEADVGGERGYRLTDDGSAALDALR